MSENVTLRETRRRLMASAPKDKPALAKPAKESSRDLWRRVTQRINAERTEAEPNTDTAPAVAAKPTPTNVRAAFARGIKQGQANTGRHIP